MTFDLDLIHWFGWLVIIGMALWIVVSYLSGKHHLITVRNTFLLGMIPFIGSSAIACATYQEPIGQYTPFIIQQFIICFGIFLVSFSVVYYFYRPPALAVNYFATAPPYTRSQPLFFAFFSVFTIVVAQLLARQFYVPVVSELASRVAPSCAIFGTVFSFGVWMRDRTNPLLLIVFISLFFISAVFAVYSGGGRRILLGVVGGLGVYYYWNDMASRNTNRIKTIAILSVFVSAVFILITAYSEVRHFDRGKNKQSRTIEKSAEVLMEVPNRIMNIKTTVTSERFHNDFGQNGVNCSLYCIYLNDKWAGQESRHGLTFPQYFHTLWFVVANPVPRRLWSYLPTRAEKPNGLGLMLPKYYNRSFIVNWGPGIVGHCFHEGGLWMAVFYGLFFGCLFKLLDVVLEKERLNLFVMAMMAAALPQIAMLSRGDNGIVLLNVIFAFILFVFMRRCGFILYGRTIRNSNSRLNA